MSNQADDSSMFVPTLVLIFLAVLAIFGIKAGYEKKAEEEAWNKFESHRYGQYVDLISVASRDEESAVFIAPEGAKLTVFDFEGSTNPPVYFQLCRSEGDCEHGWFYPGQAKKKKRPRRHVFGWWPSITLSRIYEFQHFGKWEANRIFLQEGARQTFADWRNANLLPEEKRRMKKEAEEKARVARANSYRDLEKRQLKEMGFPEESSFFKHLEEQKRRGTAEARNG